MKYKVVDWRTGGETLAMSNTLSALYKMIFKRIDDTDGECDLVVYEHILDRWIPIRAL